MDIAAPARDRGGRWTPHAIAFALPLVILAGCGVFGGGSPGRGADTPASVAQAGAGGELVVADLPTIAPILPPGAETPDPGAPAEAPAAGFAFDPDADTATRLTALETAISSLAAAFAARRPAIDRMLGIEADIRLLLSQLAQLVEPSPRDPTLPDPAPADGLAAADAEPPLELAPPLEIAPPAQPGPALPEPAPAAPAPVLSPEPVPPPAPDAELAMRAPEPPAAPAPPPEPAAAPAVGDAPGIAFQPILPAPAAAPAAPPAAAGPLSGIHLASYRQAANLETGWSVLRADYADVLRGLDYRVAEVAVPGKGTFLRLIAGPFAAATEAARACRLIESRGGFCEVAAYP